MALFRSLGARPDETRGTTAEEVRKDLAGLFTGPGVLPGSSSPLVEGTGELEYVVNAGRWVTSRGSSDGVHLWGNDGPITVATSVAPGSGLSRIDVIYALHPSADENADTDSVPVVGVAQGTAASTPIAPTIPTGALELGRNLMTSAAQDTAGIGNTISQSAPRAHLVRWDGEHVPGYEVAVAAQPSNVNCAGSDQIVVALVFQAVAGRKYLVEFDGAVFRQSSLSTRATTRLRWATGTSISVSTGTVLSTRLVDCAEDNSVEQARAAEAFVSPVTGSVALGVHGSRTSGSGVITYSGGAGNRATLRVTCVG